MREHQIVITLKPEQFLRVQSLARSAGAKSMGMFVRQQLLVALGIEGKTAAETAAVGQLNVEPMVTELKRLHGELREIVAESIAAYATEFSFAEPVAAPAVDMDLTAVVPATQMESSIPSPRDVVSAEPTVNERSISLPPRLGALFNRLNLTNPNANADVGVTKEDIERYEEAVRELAAAEERGEASQSESDFEPEPELEPDPELGANPDLDANPDLGANPDLRSNLDLRSNPDPWSNSDLRTNPELGANTEPRTNPELATESIPESEGLDAPGSAAILAALNRDLQSKPVYKLDPEQARTHPQSQQNSAEAIDRLRPATEDESTNYQDSRSSTPSQTKSEPEEQFKHDLSPDDDDYVSEKDPVAEPELEQFKENYSELKPDISSNSFYNFSSTYVPPFGANAYTASARNEAIDASDSDVEEAGMTEHADDQNDEESGEENHEYIDDEEAAMLPAEHSEDDDEEPSELAPPTLPLPSQQALPSNLLSPLAKYKTKPFFASSSQSTYSGAAPVIPPSTTQPVQDKAVVPADDDFANTVPVTTSSATNSPGVTPLPTENPQQSHVPQSNPLGSSTVFQASEQSNSSSPTSRSGRDALAPRAQIDSTNSDLAASSGAPVAPIPPHGSSWTNPAMSAEELLKAHGSALHSQTSMRASRDPLSELLGADMHNDDADASKSGRLSPSVEDDDAFDVPLSILARRQQLAAQMKAVEDPSQVNQTDKSKEKTNLVPPAKPNKPDLSEEKKDAAPESPAPAKEPKSAGSQGVSTFLANYRSLENQDDDTPFSGGPPPKRR